MSKIVDIQTPVLHWVNKRARYVKDNGNWEWVVRDPIVSCLKAALFSLDREGKITLQEKTRQELGLYYWKNMARLLVRENNLKKVINALSQEGVTVILLKGAAFQNTLYRNIGLRSMADIDILVEPENFLLSVKVLQQYNFSASSQDISKAIEWLDKLPEKFWPNELSFQNQHGMVIELHKNLIVPWFILAFPLNIDAIWERSVPLVYGDENPLADKENLCIKCLSPYDTLAHLCLNLAMHGLQNPQTYLDVDLWIRSLPDTWDWERFLNLVFQWHIRSAAFHVISICSYFMDTPLPKDIIKRLDPGWFARFRVEILISPQSILSDRPSLGRRYPSLVKLALIDRLPLIFVTLWNLAFPSKAWREYDPYGSSLLAHWLHVFKVVKRGD